MKIHGGSKMNNAFDYIMGKFLLNVTEKQAQEDINILVYNQKEVSNEFRKILDRIAIEIVYTRFENEGLIQAILSLNRMERIIVVYGLILGMNNSEVAYLLNTNLNSTGVQKCKAIKKLKTYIKNNNVF